MFNRGLTTAGMAVLWMPWKLTARTGDIIGSYVLGCGFFSLVNGVNQPGIQEWQLSSRRQLAAFRLRRRARDGPGSTYSVSGRGAGIRVGFAATVEVTGTSVGTAGAQAERNRRRAITNERYMADLRNFLVNHSYIPPYRKITEMFGTWLLILLMIQSDPILKP